MSKEKPVVPKLSKPPIHHWIVQKKTVGASILNWYVNKTQEIQAVVVREKQVDAEVHKLENNRQYCPVLSLGYVTNWLKALGFSSNLMIFLHLLYFCELKFQVKRLQGANSRGAHPETPVLAVTLQLWLHPQIHPHWEQTSEKRVIKNLAGLTSQI